MEHIREEEVRFRNGDTTLSGTLYLPSSQGRHPAIVFVHGSGQEHRKVKNFQFWERLFSPLVKNGFAVLFYDKRGCGESSGDWRLYDDRAHSFSLLADDAVAGVLALQDHEDIVASSIGVLGFSPNPPTDRDGRREDSGRG